MFVGLSYRSLTRPASTASRGVCTRAGVELISTSGTAAFLEELGLPVTRIEAITGVAEMFEGRVKTLHPKVHGALLARRDVPNDVQQLAELGVEPIDLVAVNLYPFRRVASRRDGHA